jgi:hypothetical protein
MRHKLLIFSIIGIGCILTPTYLLSQNIYSAKVIQPQPITTPSICIVNVSNDNKNVVVWEKTVDSFIDFYKIYRESTQQTGKWDYVGKTMYTSNSVFVDSTSEPLKQSYRYKISSVDKCGNETSLSTTHKTMNLSILKSANNTYSLIWDEYEGFSVSSYKIYRGTTVDNLKLIGSTTAGNFNYNDNFSPDGAIYYQIEVVSPNQCDASKLKSTTIYSSSRSNIVSNISTGFNNSTKIEFLIVQPNPFNERTILNFENSNHLVYLLNIYNVTGNLVRQQSINSSSVEIKRDGLSDGLYFIELKGNRTIKGRFIISK